MAEHGDWTRKGAVLSDVTARAEYGVSEEFIIRGINAGRLEYREGSVWGNPYLRIFRLYVNRSGWKLAFALGLLLFKSRSVAPSIGAFGGSGPQGASQGRSRRAERVCQGWQTQDFGSNAG